MFGKSPRPRALGLGIHHTESVFTHSGPNADLALARAAEQANIPFTLSTPASNSIEEVAAGAGGDKWFQLYVSSREQSEWLVRRALEAGYTTLVLTIDVAVNGLRERDIRNNFKIPMNMSPSVIWDGITHPSWSMDYLLNGQPQLANFVTKDASDLEAQANAMSRSLDATFDWASLRQLRELWPHTLLVKGILNADDAVQCVANGADCILLGQATLYGVAANGQEGVSDVLRILQNEVDNTLAQIGCSDVRDLNPGYLHEDSIRLMQQTV